MVKGFHRFLISIILSVIASTAGFAAQEFSVQLGNDYLLETDYNIKTNLVSDPSIITLSPFFTIFNDKNVLLLHPNKVGKTNFTIYLDKDSVSFTVNVKPSKGQVDTKPIELDNFEVNLLDTPPAFGTPDKSPKDGGK
jgi:hypothetical protein